MCLTTLWSRIVLFSHSLDRGHTVCKQFSSFVIIYSIGVVHLRVTAFYKFAERKVVQLPIRSRSQGLSSHLFGATSYEMDFKMPPNWRYHTHVTLGKQLTYHSIPVSSTSNEYSVVSSLLDCVQIKSVEQVVNPVLWDRFQQRRKEMLKCKSVDATALANIGLNDVEVREVLAYSTNFTPHPEVAHVPFDHNMSILFHCTANERDVESILTEGLDERLGNQTGYLGRGIYFADNPMKSMCYDGCNIIMIFAVLLGDCLLTDKKTAKNSVREPKKMDIQKRHLNDLFFDSIAARPANDNEFVIYNRYQCLPLYKVRYENSGTSDRNDHGGRKFDCDEYVQARKDFPELCWKPNDKYEHPMPSLNRLRNRSWPFDADKIFEKMSVSDGVEIEFEIDGKSGCAPIRFSGHVNKF